MLWTIFLLINGLLALVLLFYSSRSRQRNEPPLDKGLVPWLGHALEFGGDAAKFLTRMKNKHGDIFTVRVAGQYVTVLLDPASYDQVLNDGVSLDFSRNRARLMKRIFGLELPCSVDPAAETAWMRRQFNGVNLAKLSTSMGSHLEALLLAEQKGCEPSEWRQEGLFSLCYSLLFRAGYLTLFERSNNAADVYKEFRKFDALLSKMARGTLRTEEKKMASSSRERLWELLSPAWLRSGGPGGPSERSGGPWGSSERSGGPSERNEGPGGPSEPTSGSWQQSYEQYLQEEKVDLEMQKRALLLQLWTTQGNAGPCAFWLLSFLLTQPEAMRAVQAEITEILAGQGAPKQHPNTPSTPSTLQGAPKQHPTTPSTLQGAPKQHPTTSPLHTLLDTHCTPVLDSVLRETLRLTAAAIISRQAVQSKVLRMSNGREYHVRQGDKICLFPFLSPQTDPGIHHQPQTFKYDRFLNADKTEKKTFYKDGERLKYYSMPWGGGSNVCVGKQFATTGIKQFVLTVLTRLDVELCDPQARVPPINPSRYGFGMLQPIGDLQVRYRLKTTTTSH